MQPIQYVDGDSDILAHHVRKRHHSGNEVIAHAVHSFRHLTLSC